MARATPSINQHFDRPNNSPGFLLWQVAMCWQHKINKVLSPFGLTYTQFIVLVVSGWLTRENKNIYQHQIALYARIDRMMTSRIITSLEKKNYVNRQKKSDDARTNTISITEKGADIIIKSLQAASEMEHDFFIEGNQYDSDFINYMQDLLSKC